MAGFLRAFFQRGRRPRAGDDDRDLAPVEPEPRQASYEDGYTTGFADGEAAERAKKPERKPRNVKAK